MDENIERIVITPSKPRFIEEFWHSIHLNDDQVDLSPIREMAEDNGFREQTNKHITVIGSKCRNILVQKMDEMDKPAQERLITSISGLSNSLDWSFAPGDIYRISKSGTFGRGSTLIENRESYVQLIEMPAMLKFYTELSRIFNQPLTMQMPHITLFTKGDREGAVYRGISVPSIEEFQNLKPVKIEIK